MTAETTLSGNEVSTDRLVGNFLILNDIIIANITHDPNNTEQSTLPSSFALSMLKQNIEEELDTRFDEISKTYREVFSTSIVNKDFHSVTTDATLGWSSLGYTHEDTRVVYTETGSYTDTNKLAIPQGRYSRLGQYFLYFTIDKIVGNVNVYKSGYLIKSFTETGVACVNLDITSLLSDDVYIKCEHVPLNDTVVFSGAYCVYTIDELYYYVLNFIKERVDEIGNDAGFITEAELNAAVAQALTSANAALQAHILANNPHNITPAGIGAAEQVHTHSQYVTHDELENINSNTYTPPEVILEGPLSYFPREIAHGFLPLTSFIRTKTLSHTGGSNYSPYSGYIQSNVLTTEPLSDAVDPNIVIDNRYTKLTYADKIVIKYTLMSARPISYITLVSPNNGTDRKANVISISDGTNVLEVDISSSDKETVTWSYENDVSELLFTITSTTTQTSTDVLFGFDIEFSDVTSGNILVTKDIKFSNINGGLLKIYTLANDLFISSSSLAVGHPYYISLLYTDDTPSVELLGVHPSYGYDDDYATYPFRTLESLQDTYYGTLVTTGLTYNLTGYDIYKPDSTTTTTNRVTVTHSFVNALTIKEFTLYVNKDIDSSVTYPSTYKVTFTLSDNTTVIKQSSVLNYFINTPSEKISIDILGNNTISNVVSYVAEIESVNNTIVHISSIDVGIENKYYNTQTHSWNDSKVRQIIGTIQRLSTDAVVVTSAPLGKLACIPINNFDRCEIGQSYKVPNPFNTVLIQEVNFADLYNSGTFMIKSITDTEIEVITDSEIIGYITVTRTW